MRIIGENILLIIIKHKNNYFDFGHTTGSSIFSGGVHAELDEQNRNETVTLPDKQTEAGQTEPGSRRMS